jgi:regulator of sirC expression with transglutaminase-like and TPR domain
MMTTIGHLGLLDDEEIDLDVAALELSALDHDGIDLDPYLGILKDMAERLSVVGRAAFEGQAQAEALAHVFAGEYGFSGDRKTYDAPLNADMVRVIDRRKGLPVSLSILYIAAARRVGWTADALNTPGHVLARVGPADSAVLIDPFGGGAIVGSEKLDALLGHEGAGDDLVMPNRMVLVRLLLNQVSRAEQAGDVGRAMAVLERMVVVAPSHGQGWWDLARLQLGTGSVESARDSLSAMLEVTRDPDRRAHVTAALEAIAGK